MNINALIQELHDRNIQISLDDRENLKIIADKGVLDDDLKRQLMTHKADLIAWILNTQQQTSKSNLPPLSKAEHATDIPLSYAQQRLWFVDLLEKDSSAYTISAAAAIRGMLDSKRLFHAIDRIMMRHESLRTLFYQNEGAPYQRVHNEAKFDYCLIDLRGGDEELQRHLKEEISQKFNLNTGPLLKARLYRNAADDHVLLICMHHIVSDGWSNHIFLSELAHYYNDPDDHLPALPLQYKDFSVWQRACLSGDYKTNLLNYWKKQLDGWQAINLLHDKPRSAQITRSAGQWHMHIEKSFLDNLKQLSHKQNITLFTLLLSVFYVLLAKYTGQTNLCVGTDVANRTRVQLEGLIGFFVNQLVLRATWSGDPCFDILLQKIKAMALEAYSYQDLPFDVLVDELLDHHDLSHTPFFPVKFIMQNTPQSKIACGDWIIEPLKLPYSHAKFEMTWSVTESDQGLELEIEYDSELFEPETIARYARHYLKLLSDVLREPKQAISQMVLCDEHDLKDYRDWNTRAVQQKPPQSLAAMLEDQVLKCAEAVAVTDRMQQLSYAELNSKSNRLAHYLLEWGLETESTVGVCMPSSVDYIVTVCALSKIGAILVPMDVKLPSERMAQIIQDAALSVLITQTTCVDRLPAYELNFIPLLCLDEHAEDYADADDTNLNLACHATQLAYMIFTSGTTGKPKGVMVGNAGLSTLAQEQATRFNVSSKSKILQFASIGFDASIWEIVMALGNGATLHCEARDQIMPGIQLARYIAEHQITHITLPPSALSVMPAEALPSLQVLILAGEICKDEVLRNWHPRVDLFNAYGPSETTVCATIANLDRVRGGFNHSIGTPIQGSEVYIIDIDGNLAPAGVSGELCIGGISLGRGYWQDSAKTAEKFIPDAYSGKSGTRIYRTGDKARYRKDGSIEFLGRFDQQIKLRGYRIELKEIESQLLLQPEVKEAVAIVNEQEQAVYAFVVGTHMNLDTSALRSRLRDFLPEYMIPKRIISIERIPITVNGKLDIKALPACNAPEEDRAWQDQDLNPLETSLHAIWIEVLKLDGIAKHENFFDAGGNSLLLVKVQEMILRDLEIELNVADLFKYPSISGLAEFLQQGHGEDLFINLEQRIAKKRQSSGRRAKRKQLDTAYE